MPKRNYPKISFIGTGSVGSSLAVAFSEKGYPIVSLINRTGASAIALARTVTCKKVSTRVEDISPGSDIIFITVSDDAIRNVAKELSVVKRLKFNNIFVAHTSGVHSSAILDPVRNKGAITASMHPIQTFPKRKKASKVRNIYFGIEGTVQALPRARQLVNDLDARWVVIPEQMKPLYHAACVFSSGYIVVLMNVIQELTKKLQVVPPWTEMFGPLMTSAMENAITRSAGSALTGPVVRGDLETINLHMTSLAAHTPEFMPLYIVAGIELARVARENGNLTLQEYQALVTHFRNFISSIPTTKQSKGKK